MLATMDSRGDCPSPQECLALWRQFGLRPSDLDRMTVAEVRAYLDQLAAP